MRDLVNALLNMYLKVVATDVPEFSYSLKQAKLISAAALQ